MKRLSHYPPLAAVIITGIVLISQLTVEVGFWWVTYACAGAFAVGVFYAIAVIVYNAWVDYRTHIRARGEK